MADGKRATGPRGKQPAQGPAKQPAARQQPQREFRTKEEALQEMARRDPRRAAALLREILEKGKG